MNKFIFILFFIIINGCVDESGDCRLIEAAAIGDVKLLDRELRRGCDPSADECRAVYNAIIYDHLEILNKLLDAGVDPSYDWGIVPFENEGYDGVLDECYWEEDRGNLLTVAVQFGNIEIIRSLISHGANVNRKVGKSPLLRAYILRDNEIYLLLKSHGAVFNSCDKYFLNKFDLPFSE